MILPRSFQRRVNPGLYDAIQPYRVTDDSQMPLFSDGKVEDER